MSVNFLLRRISVLFVIFAWGVIWSSGYACARACIQDGNDDSAIIDPIVANGSFEDWQAGQPASWEVGTGATDGANNPKSKLEKDDGPSLRLSGDQTTMAWQFVSQVVDVKPEDTIRLSFQAKSNNLKRQRNQKDNCFVGLVPTDVDGNRLSPTFLNIDSNDYAKYSETITTEKEMVKAEVWIFLSKTGSLNVKDLKIERLEARDSFDILVADMGRHYSFFELKKIDWKELSDKYRIRAMAAKTTVVFAGVVAEMLGELNDMHTWVVNEQHRYETVKSDYERNCDFNVVAKHIKAPSQFRGMGIVGTTKEGFCYINLRSLTLPLPVLSRVPTGPDFKPSRLPLERILKGIVSHADAPGMILDIRQNRGGNEEIAKEIAGLFIDKETMYSKSRFRSGESPNDFTQPFPRTFAPTGKRVYRGPVVCLIGPGTVSSAEAMAMMMKSLPNCTLIGKSTRGASGNPRPIKLPNGVEVWYSRWKSLLPDETCIEGVGIQPDIEVEHQQGSDLTFDKAIEVLKSKAK